jgi:hypothetical protein
MGYLRLAWPVTMALWQHENRRWDSGEGVLITGVSSSR